MKPVTSDSYLVRPFTTHKTQTYTYRYLTTGSNPDQVSIDLAVAPASTWRMDEEYPQDENPNGINKWSLYAGVQHLLYRSNSLWEAGPSLERGFYPTGSQFYVFSIAQSSYGEKIRPSTLTITTPHSTGSLQDDGDGKIVSADDSTKVVGNIFYSLGIGIVQQSSSSFSSSVICQDGMFVATGSTINVSFQASHTIYEHQVVCTMEAGEYNYSTNPSMNKTGSGGGKIFDAFASGTLTPYMTTVACYSDAGELVAIGKFPRPIKRVAESQQSVIIRFDI